MMDNLTGLLNDIQELLLTYRQSVRISDIIDILIITVVIYRVLAFARKTSASSVIKGLILIVAVAVVAMMFRMNVLTYLLQQVLQMGIVVIVVLFQPEIRKLFERMGTSKLSTIFRKRGRSESLECGVQSVVAACVSMAKSKTGALVVFEREVGLNDYAVTGTMVDAQTSSNLILNIFYVNSPLHDGALLIREGRLLAAACMLPLSNNINLGRDLGMRHRAGVGISERSDAVVIIVSEESGTISVAVDGMLKRHLDKDTFELLLRNELALSNDVKTRKKKMRKGKKSKVEK